VRFTLNSNLRNSLRFAGCFPNLDLLHDSPYRLQMMLETSRTRRTRNGAIFAIRFASMQPHGILPNVRILQRSSSCCSRGSWSILSRVLSLKLLVLSSSRKRFERLCVYMFTYVYSQNVFFCIDWVKSCFIRSAAVRVYVQKLT